MTRKPHLARTPAIFLVVASVAALGGAAVPAPAHGQVEIPLDSAISPQYHAVDAAAAVEAATAPEPVVEAAAPPIPEVPAAPAPEPAAPAPEPADHLESEAQYHAPNNSEYHSNEAPAEASAPSPAAPEPPAEPAPSQPAENRDEPVAKDGGLADVVERVATQAAPAGAEGALQAGVAEEPAIAELPAVLEVPEASGDEPQPQVVPQLPSVPVVPDMPALAGNLNLSIRIFSPGDDGPVTQIVQGGSGGSSGPASAPTTWTWIWNWIGAPGCDSGQAGAPAPPLGIAGWNWTWNWSCDGAAGAPNVPVPPIAVRGIGELPGLEQLAALESLPSVELPLDELLGAIAGPSPLSTIAGLLPAKPAADAPESRAGRERPGGPSDLLAGGRAAARARPLQPQGIAIFAPASATGARELAPAHALKRAKGRDIAAEHLLIPADTGLPAPSAAVASGAAAAGAGASSAVLTTLILLSLSVLAGALLAGVGLPRLKPRASRLERPG